MGVIMHNNISYGGGSSIEPNPQESATEQLETLGIDGDVYEVTDADAIHTSDVGIANGVAELDSNGKVPSSQLPSYVDDVVEYASRSAFPATGESGKIYVALDTNLTYRWSGTEYVEISPSLALGETSSTAYRGDRGKIAYDHSQSDHSGIKPAFTEASTRANIASGESFATILGKIKKFFSDLKDLAFIGKDGASSTKYLRGDGTWQNFPTIPTVNNGTLTIQKNGTNVQTFSANQSANATANIECANPSDVEGSKVATGNPLTITDAAGIKAEKIEIGFEPQQDKHGYNSVWVGGAGKNKCEGRLVGRNIGSDGRIGGTAEFDICYGKVTQNQIYTITTDDSSGFVGGFFTSVPTDTSTTYNNQRIVTSNKTFTAPIDGYVGFRTMTGYATAQLEIGSQPTSFEPYENISPITGYTSLSANRCGKNIFDATDRKGSYDSGFTSSFDKATQQLTCTGKWYGTWIIRVKQNTNYHLTREIVSYTRSRGINIYASDGVNIDTGTLIAGIRIADELTFNSGSNKFVAVLVYAGDNTSGTTIQKIQIEEGSSYTEYNAFNGDNVTVQLGQTLYGGKLTILQDGSADVDVDTGFDVYTGENTENWVFSYQNSYYQAARENTTMKNSLDAFTNEFENIALSDRGTKNGFVTYSDKTIRVALLPSFGITSVAQWQTFLASHNLQVAYKLATPFTIHFSPVETLTLLQGLNNVWTDGTTLSLTYQPDNAIGQAKGTAQELVDSASTWKLFAESANANIPLPTNCEELYICVIYVTGSTSAIMYNFHILPDILTKATSYFRQGDYYTPDYFSRCEIRIRKTSNVYDTRVECLYMNNTTDRAANTKVKVYYR